VRLPSASLLLSRLSRFRVLSLSSALTGEVDSLSVLTVTDARALSGFFDPPAISSAIITILKRRHTHACVTDSFRICRAEDRKYTSDAMRHVTHERPRLF